MTNLESAGEPRVAAEILGYFLRNPGAADDAIGIASWRLLRERVQQSVADSEAALALLVDRGFLLVERRAGRVIFRINPERTADAAEYLRRHPAGWRPPHERSARDGIRQEAGEASDTKGQDATSNQRRGGADGRRTT